MERTEAPINPIVVAWLGEQQRQESEARQWLACFNCGKPRNEHAFFECPDGSKRRYRAVSADDLVQRTPEQMSLIARTDGMLRQRRIRLALEAALAWLDAKPTKLSAEETAGMIRRALAEITPQALDGEGPGGYAATKGVGRG